MTWRLDGKDVDSMRIRVVVPSITEEFEALGLEQYSPGARPGTEISVTLLDRAVPMFHEHAHRMGVTESLASVRAVNIPVLELGDTERVVKALVEQSVVAVREDGAHLIVFGCTGMIGLAGEVEKGLVVQGIADVPVIDPGILAIKFAEALADIGVSHSKRTYPHPPEKEIAGY